MSRGGRGTVRRALSVQEDAECPGGRRVSRRILKRQEGAGVVERVLNGQNGTECPGGRWTIRMAPSVQEGTEQ